MGIEKWNPIGELISLQDRMNNLLKDALSSANLSNDRSGITWSPPVDFFETPDEFVLMAELPGMRTEDVKIKVEENTLVLAGERKWVESENKQGEFFRRERFQGGFHRTFSLPAAVRTNDISAKLSQGLLEVHLPKDSKEGGQTISVSIDS